MSTQNTAYWCRLSRLAGHLLIRTLTARTSTVRRHCSSGPANSELPTGNARRADILLSHFMITTIKPSATVKALVRISPNIGGVSGRISRLYRDGVIHANVCVTAYRPERKSKRKSFRGLRSDKPHSGQIQSHCIDGDIHRAGVHHADRPGNDGDPAHLHDT